MSLSDRMSNARQGVASSASSESAGTVVSVLDCTEIALTVSSEGSSISGPSTRPTLHSMSILKERIKIQVSKQ